MLIKAEIFILYSCLMQMFKMFCFVIGVNNEKGAGAETLHVSLCVNVKSNSA